MWGSLVIIPLFSDVCSFPCHLLSKGRNLWNEHFPLNYPQSKNIFLMVFCIQFNLSPAKYSFSWNRGRNHPFRVSFRWIYACTGTHCVCVCTRMCELCVVSAVQAQNLCCSVQLKEIRISELMDRVTAASSMCQPLLHPAHRRCCQSQGNTEPNAF